MWVKPADGLRFRDPRTGQLLPEDGAAIEVDDHDYAFHQRLNHGDLVRCFGEDGETVRHRKGGGFERYQDGELVACAEDGSDLPPPKAKGGSKSAAGDDSAAKTDAQA